MNHRLLACRVIVGAVMAAAFTGMEFGQTVVAPYDDTYSIADLGPVPGVPSNYGGLTFKFDDSNTIFIGGSANSPSGQLFSIQVVRDANHHVTGFTGTAVLVAEAAYNDGGVTYGPDHVLFLARWPVNEIGQTKPGSALTDKVIDLTPLGVEVSPGGLSFVPAGFPGGGLLKAASYSGGQWYTLSYVLDASGTFDITQAVHETTIAGAPEGFIYVPPGSAHFTDNRGMLVSEYGVGIIAAYSIDDTGDPIPATRAEFITGLSGAEGAVTDPLTGDFLFSTFGGGNHVIAVRGFAAPPQDADGDGYTTAEGDCDDGNPSIHPGVLETCNNVDDDCDGSTDEELGSTSCGIGACARTRQNCVDGQPQSCVPGSPAAEICNGIDDDCDGSTDEGLETTTCGVGACLRTGGACVNGQPPSCVPGSPVAETCNGVDDDCDGTTDEGLGSVSCGVGACARTQQSCVNGQPRSCVPGSSAAETCNGLDDDCDGSTDEDLGTTACGVGACLRMANDCLNGSPQSCVPGQPAVEICGDGVDQDCDGQDTSCGNHACPRGKGYWKNHPQAWPVASLILGSQTYDQTELLSLLKRPVHGDASLILAQKLITAKLNIAAGSDVAPVAPFVAHADGLLSAYPGKLPYGVKTRTPSGQDMVHDGGDLNQYNKRKLTPGCTH